MKKLKNIFIICFATIVLSSLPSCEKEKIPVDYTQSDWKWDDCTAKMIFYEDGNEMAWVSLTANQTVTYRDSSFLKTDTTGWNVFISHIDTTGGGIVITSYDSTAITQTTLDTLQIPDFYNFISANASDKSAIGSNGYSVSFITDGVETGQFQFFKLPNPTHFSGKPDVNVIVERPDETQIIKTLTYDNFENCN